MRNTKKLVSKSKKRFLALGLAMAMAASSLSPMGALPVFAAEDARAASKNNADGATVAASTVATLKSTEYNGLASLVARTYYTSTEKLNKKTEIYNRGGYASMNDITDAMVLAELNVDDLKVMSFEAAYAKVQEDLDILIPLIVQNSQFWGSGDENTYFTNTILNNKEKLLLGLTYIYRLYDFNIGDVNIKDKLFEDVDYFGKDYDQLQWLITLGGLGGDALKLANNTNIFTGYFANKVTTSTSVTAFIENEIAKNSGLTAAQWFKDFSDALIVEKESDVLGGTAKLYNRLKSSYPSYILPILNVSENSIYVVSTPGAITFGLVDCYVNRSNKGTSTYDSDLASFKNELTRHADLQTRYLELWTRIAKEDDHGELVSNRVVLDAMRIKGFGSYESAQQEWSPKVGDNVSLGVEEFFAPMNIYTTYTAADAQAETNSGTITFWMSKAIGDKGLITYTHELTHLLVNSVWLNDYNSREGLEGEFFTRGLFETFYSTYFDPQMSLNMILDYSNDSKRIYNATPERFQNTEDLKAFTQGMMDVLYTLDYMEAQAILEKSATEKAAWFHQLNQKAATRQSNQGNANAQHTNDNIVSIDETLAGSLLTLDDLIDNNIVTSRHSAQNGLTTGEVKSEEYHSVPMFSACYAVAQNDRGASGAYTGRRMAFDLLAEYGYYEGMVPYISNQYLTEAETRDGVLSDTYIFEKIWGNQYADAKAFKKAMYDRRAQKLNQLKPITINVDGVVTNITSADQLQNMMNAAVVSDLPGMPYQYGSYASYSAVEKLKAAVYTAYLQSTNDFTTSIYTDEAPTPSAEPTAEPTTVPTAEPTTVPTTEPTTEPTPAPVGDPEIPSDHMNVSVSGTFDVSGRENYTDASPEVIKEAIFDDSKTTWWNSTHLSGSTITKGNPHLTIDLGASYDLSKLEYTPRWDGGAKWACTGNISNLIIEVSADGQTWTDVTNGGQAVDLTTTDASAYPLAINMTADNVRYVRISGTASHHWDTPKKNTSITIADLSLYGELLPISADVMSATGSGTYQTTPSNEGNASNVSWDTVLVNLFDKDYTNTFWNSNHLSGTTISNDNPYLIIDLNGGYDLTRIDYVPRLHSGSWNCTGNIQKLNIEVSSNGVAWAALGDELAGSWTALTPDGGETIALDGSMEFPHEMAVDAEGVRYIRFSGDQSYHWQQGQTGQPDNRNTSITIADLAIYGFQVAEAAEPTPEPTPSASPTPTEEPVYGDYPMAGSIPASDATITNNQPFAAGTANSNIFRIPCLITLDSGDILGAADIRYVEYGDWGGIDTIAAISKDDGATWKYSFPINFPDSDGSAGTSTSSATKGIATTAIDPILVQGPDGTIYCMADMNPSGITTQDTWPRVGTGFVTIDGVERLALTSNYSNANTQPTDSDLTTYEYYVGDFDENGFAPVLKRSDNSASGYGVDEWFNLYGVVNGRYVKSLTQTQVDSSTVIQQNAFYKDSVLHVYNTGYIWLVTSNDGGMTWDNPQILNTQVKRDNETALLVSPGRGLVTSEGDILVGCYNAFQSPYSESASAFYLKAGSTTWQRTSNDVMNVAKSSENEIVELYNGTLRMFYRSDTMKMCYADITKDANGNYVMGDGHELGISISSNCNISAIKLEQTTIGGKPVVLTSVPEGPGSWNRVKGRIYVFTINEDNTMNHISTYKFNEDTFAYSCMTELEDGNIGILWEPGINQASAIRYSEVAIADIIPDTEKDVVLNVGEKYKETIISNAALTVGGTPNASVAKVQITTTEGEKLALCDKNSTTANTALTMEGAGLTFTATDTENVWKITTEDGLFMVNRQASGGPVTFFRSEEGTMTVTPEGDGSFAFMDTLSGRYTMYFTTNSNFNAMGSKTAGANYKYGLTLLEKQDTISTDDTIPGYKQVNMITSGKTYLVTYVHNGTRYVLYPSTATSAWDSYTKTPTMVPAYVNELVITGMGAGSTAAVIGNMTYNIKVNTGGVVEVRLKVGETYLAEGLMTTRPSESIVGINEVSKGYTKLTAFDQLTEGKYLIGANSFIMKNEAEDINGDPLGLGTQTIDTNNLAGISYPQYLWTIKAANGGYTVQDVNDKYLTISAVSSDSAPVTLEDASHVFAITDAGDGKFFFGSTTAKYGSNAYYLNNFRGNNDNIAAYSPADNGAKMFLYKAANPEITLTAEHVGETIMVIGGTTYKITVYDDVTPTPPETVTPEPEVPEASALKEVVIDFGLPTVIHLDPLGGNTDASVLVAGTANYGTVAVSGDIANGWDITYTPNKVLTDKDVVTLTTQDANTTYSVNVYPANSVFYEETFMETVKGTWEQKGDISVNQEAAAIGDTQNGAENYGYDVVYEGQEILTASATGNADSSLVQFNGSVEMLEDCLYTFTSAGTENEYYISSVNADGNQVYLNFQGGGKEGRRPHSKDQSVIVLVEKEATPGIIYFKDKVGSGSGSYLHFRNTSSAGLYFDRCSGNNCAEHKLKVYEWTDVVTAGAEIPGYKQVTSAADIKDGGRYLIVAEGTDANSKAQKYLLHPPVGNGNATADYHNASVAPSWMHVAQLSRQNQVRTEVVTTEINAEKSFAFKGTGVDIYANSSKDTGIAMVMIKNADNSDKIEKFVMVDTRLPEVGELAASPLASMIDTLAGMETAYNVPIVSISGLDLANYKVSVIHAKKDSETSLKLDGFRTYGTLTDTNVYAADKENNVVYKDFKDSLLAAWSVSNPDGKLADALANNTYNQIYNSAGADLGAGVVLLDSANTINFTNEDVRTEFLNKTSKNEVYLYPGQSLTFKVAASNVNPQIGLRSLKEGVKYSVTANGGAAANAEMNATTEMYYPLAMSDADTTFVITNTGKDGILAVTKLKASNPTGVVMLSNVTEKDIAMALISMGIAEGEETPVPTVTETPAVTPTVTPTVEPTTDPTVEPTVEPTTEPTETEAPTPTETEAPAPSETPEEAKDVTEVFSDVHTDWYTDYVQYVYDNGLMTGIKGTDRFEPNANITKAQVAQVLYNMEGQPMVTNLKVIYELSDIPEIEWYTRAVAWAYNRGIVTGDTNAKKFFPNADVTREQLALMMYRYAEWKKYDVSATSDFAGLENAENVSNWAAEGMSWAVGEGLISGVEKDGVKDLDPQGNATRAQMAAILQRFCDAVK